MDPKPEYEALKYKGSDKLRNKRAIITGGDSGIGRSVAVLFAREGADIAIVHLPEEQEDATETANAVEAEGRKCFTLAADLSKSSDCYSVVEKCAASLGGIDILVNNSAFQNHIDTIDELTEEQWDRTFRTNIYGFFFMTKAALEHMGEGSVIINTGSITGLEGSKALLDYSATKGAIHAFTKALAQQLIEKKIRVNCIAPGPVWTPLNPAERSDEETKSFGQSTPLGRPAQPEEIAPAFVYFASNVDSSYVTGEVLTLLGGETRAA